MAARPGQKGQSFSYSFLCLSRVSTQPSDSSSCLSQSLTGPFCGSTPSPSGGKPSPKPHLTLLPILPPGVRGPTPFLASHIFINILSFLCPPALEAAPVPLNSKIPIGVSPGINQQGATVGGRLSEALRSLANKSGSCLCRSEGRESFLHLPAQADS